VHGSDGERSAVNGDIALVYDMVEQIFLLEAESEVEGVAVFVSARDGCSGVDMTLRAAG